MSGLTLEAIVRGLVAAGVPQDRAEAQARRECGLAEPSRPLLAAFKAIEALPTRASVEPITLRIPWSALVSDNDKFVAQRRGDRAIMVITSQYATAKERIAGVARDAMTGRAPFAVPLSISARVLFPSKRTNDVSNWCKLVHDALNGIVYEDDRWLHDVRWIRAGVDVDAPRCELTITPL